MKANALKLWGNCHLQFSLLHPSRGQPHICIANKKDGPTLWTDCSYTQVEVFLATQKLGTPHCLPQ